MLNLKSITHTLALIMLIEEDISFGKSDREELQMLLNLSVMFIIISGDSILLLSSSSVIIISISRVLHCDTFGCVH